MAILRFRLAAELSLTALAIPSAQAVERGERFFIIPHRTVRVITPGEEERMPGLGRPARSVQAAVQLMIPRPRPPAWAAAAAPGAILTRPTTAAQVVV